MALVVTPSAARLRIGHDGERGGVGVAGQHQVAAAVVARGHCAAGAEAGDGVDLAFDRRQRFARRDRDRVGVGADIDQQIAAGVQAGQRDRTGRRRRRGRRGLLRLLRGRQRLFEQAGQAGEAVIGRVERLLALADLIEQGAEIVGAVVQRLRGEIGGRIVEGSVDLLAGRQMLLRGGQVGGGILQRKQVLPNPRTQGDVR